MTTRYDIERAVESSGLAPVSRHILLVLCTRMQQGSTEILQHHSPSLSRLARGTGWSRRTIMRYLAELEEAKWVERHRPPPYLARTVYMTTRYVVHEPDTLGTDSPGLESGGPGVGTDGPGLGSGSAGLGAEGTADQICSDPELDREIDLVITELEKRTGQRVSREWAAQVRDQIVNRPGVRNRAGYLKSVLGRHPDKHLPAREPDRAGELCRRCKLPGHATADCPY